MADARDEALALGAQLADIETRIGQIAGMVMQAAVHHQVGVLVTARGMIDELVPMVNQLDVLAYQMQYRLTT
jgi:hypothetical protein